MKDRYFFKNSRLFSDYYLKELLPNDPIWEIDVSEYFKKVKEIYERKKDVLESLNEPSLEDQFIRPILRVLGHKWEVQPSLKKFKKPDYSFYKTEEEKIDSELSKDYFGNAIAVGEVKRWGRQLDRKLKDEVDPFEVYTPSLQMERYLWLTEVKWGILTNGKFWRIYERNTSNKLDIYYEIDLVNILENNDLEAFKYFYLFFRKKSFPYFLNKVYEESIDYAQAIGEDLKSNVYKALRILANGFLQTPGNDLSIKNFQEIHNNSLIFLYRMLFILYAEARGLLPLQNPKYREPYSFYSIKNDVAKKIDKNEPIPILQKGYWSRVNVLCDLINNGSESYDISEDEFFVPPYNGGLFDPDKNKFLEENEVSDHFIVDVIDLLSRSTIKNEGRKAFVDYSSLDIRHLGSIYEGLLENKLKVAQEDMSAIKRGKKEIWIKTSKLGKRKEIDNVSSGQLYPVTDKGERKATGSYYTPDYIVKYIVENTIGPLIEEKKNKIEREEDLIDEILSLKILDPAMGSGHFLVESTDFIAKCLVEALGVSSKEIEEEDIRWARREVVERCIYGVDLNPLAVELAKLSLWLSTLSINKPLSFLDHHLKCGNSLIGARIEDLAELPGIKREKVKKMIGQISTYEILFNKKIEVLLNNRKFIEELPSEKVEQIREKEIYEKEFRKKIERFKQIADLWTSIYFSNEISYENYNTAQDKLESLEIEWQKIINEEWFKRELNIYRKKRFFHWELEFPEIFYIGEKKKENPGFDAMVGNPPYIGTREMSAAGMQIEKDYFAKTFKSAFKGYDIYVLFIELGMNLLQKHGVLGFIIPNKFCVSDYGYKIREILLQNTKILEITDISNLNVFPESSVYPNLLFFKNDRYEGDYAIKVITDFQKRKYRSLSKSYFEELENKLFVIHLKNYEWDLIKKIFKVSDKLKTVANVHSGTTGFEAHKMKNCIYDFKITGSSIARFIVTSNIGRYKIMPGNVTFMKSFYVDPYVNLQNPYISEGRKELYRKEKIVIGGMTTRIEATFEKEPLSLGVGVYAITNASYNMLFLLSCINSRLLNYYYTLFFQSKHLAGGYLAINKKQLEQLPIRRIAFVTPKEERQRLEEELRKIVKKEKFDEVLLMIDKYLPKDRNGNFIYRKEKCDIVHDLLVFIAQQMIEMNKQLYKEINDFLNWLEHEINIEINVLSGKTIIKNYHNYSIEDMIKQLNKNRKKLQIDPSNRNFQQKLSVEFSKSVNKVNMMKENVRKTDYLIDQIIYKLYGLTDEEIEIVEKEPK